jgi:ABC-type transport system involved in cytochrome c biogenesis ATPase subunit
MRERDRWRSLVVAASRKVVPSFIGGQDGGMHVTTLYANNFRSLVDVEIELSRVNVLIGPNNAGKSSIIRALYAVQQGSGHLGADVRIGHPASEIRLTLAAVNGMDAWGDAGQIGEGVLSLSIPAGSPEPGVMNMRGPSTTYGVGQLPMREPAHFIVPYLSKRKAVTYQEDVRAEHAFRVSPQFDYLAAKLSRLGNASFPAGARYRETCERVLGFVVTAVPSANGQRPGLYLPDRTTLPLEQMGEGVPNIVGLLADLALSEGKLLLIEEPENDLHPRALKALLDLIEESAQSNQIVVSSHSNIVARHLGSTADARLYHVDSVPGEIPVRATVRLVDSTPGARLAVLRDLGYSLSDLDLWDGWLILEESSAERIIRDYLIPWFAPKLSRVRTVAAAGSSNVEPTFDDFHRLVRFTHLEEVYRSATWVRVDGDTPGHAMVERLRQRYPSWTPEQFGTFSAPYFEHYYPAAFAEEIAAAAALEDRQARRTAKRQLLNDVRAWLDADRARGKAALAKSATDVIADLVQIEALLMAA